MEKIKQRLTLVIGAPSSGKSKLIEKLLSDTLFMFDFSCSAIFDIKKMDKIVTDSQTDGYDTVRYTAEYMLKDGFDVLVEWGFDNKASRQQFVSLGKKLGCEVFCIWVNTGIDKCISNGGESNQVYAYFDNFEKPTKKEFDEVLIYK